MKTTRDAFLGGRVNVSQPSEGFRAGVDAVLLAAACPAKTGDCVLELGCGVGTAGLCLAARVAVSVTGVELQPAYAQLARANAAAQGGAMQVVSADLRTLPPQIAQISFDHVIANPPYFQRDQGTSATDSGRDIALGGDTPLRDWITVAARRLRPRGWLTMIQRTDRLPDMLGALPETMGSVSVLPIAARQGRAPHLVILRSRKDGRAPFAMLPAFVMHEGAAHLRDADDYTAAARAVLREAAPLPQPR